VFKYRSFYPKNRLFSNFRQKHKGDPYVFFRILGKIRSGITIFRPIRRSRGGQSPLVRVCLWSLKNSQVWHTKSMDYWIFTTKQFFSWIWRIFQFFIMNFSIFDEFFDKFFDFWELFNFWVNFQFLMNFSIFE
jgi:hypothetical protein